MTEYAFCLACVSKLYLRHCAAVRISQSNQSAIRKILCRRESKLPYIYYCPGLSNSDGRWIVPSNQISQYVLLEATFIEWCNGDKVINQPILEILKLSNLDLKIRRRSPRITRSRDLSCHQYLNLKTDKVSSLSDE